MILKAIREIVGILENISYEILMYVVFGLSAIGFLVLCWGISEVLIWPT